MDYDANGWAASKVEPLPISTAYTLLSPDPSSRIDIALWANKARVFFNASLELVHQKAYPKGETPEADSALFEIRRGKTSPPAKVELITLPLQAAPEALAAAEAGARAIGGAGMDALVARAKRAWQIQNTPIEGQIANSALLLAAIVASVLLAPIVPPGGGTIFGVKGARERLGLS